MQGDRPSPGRQPAAPCRAADLRARRRRRSAVPGTRSPGSRPSRCPVAAPAIWWPGRPPRAGHPLTAKAHHQGRAKARRRKRRRPLALIFPGKTSAPIWRTRAVSRIPVRAVISWRPHGAWHPCDDRGMSDQVTLRPVSESDLPILQRLTHDPETTGEFAWAGWSDPQLWRRGWEETA